VQVMMEFRNSDSRHVDWVKALKELFQQLKAYVKQHHMAGPAWNPQGIALPDFNKGASTSGASPAASTPASAPKPPPPGISSTPLSSEHTRRPKARLLSLQCCIAVPGALNPCTAEHA